MSDEEMTAMDRMIDDALAAIEGYCDYCEVEGHTFRTCPRRDDSDVAIP